MPKFGSSERRTPSARKRKERGGKASPRVACHDFRSPGRTKITTWACIKADRDTHAHSLTQNSSHFAFSRGPGLARVSRSASACMSQNWRFPEAAATQCAQSQRFAWRPQRQISGTGRYASQKSKRSRLPFVMAVAASSFLSHHCAPTPCATCRPRC